MIGSALCPFAHMGQVGRLVGMTMPTGHSGSLVETDARGRVSLGRPDRRYLLHEEPDGTLILQPAAVVSELELKFLSNSALQAQIAYAKAHPEQRVKRRKR